MAKESPLGIEPEPAPIARERVWAGAPIKGLRRKLANLLRAFRIAPRNHPPEPNRFFNRQPISQNFGFDRGRPLDRCFIEQFLQSRANFIHGHVLEVKDATYTRMFGGDRVEATTVIDIDRNNKQATLICDLSKPNSLPREQFDCIVVTQTLQYVLNLRNAFTSLADSLKPGGYMLATFPGITRVDPRELDTWLWSFTEPVIRQLAAEVIPDPEVAVFGNLPTATAFLHGYAVEDLNPDLLKARCRDYPIVITLFARKPLANP
jgi:hypothetical protein